MRRHGRHVGIHGHHRHHHGFYQRHRRRQRRRRVAARGAFGLGVGTAAAIAATQGRDPMLTPVPRHSRRRVFLGPRMTPRQRLLSALLILMPIVVFVVVGLVVGLILFFGWNQPYGFCAIPGGLVIGVLVAIVLGASFSRMRRRAAFVAAAAVATDEGSQLLQTQFQVGPQPMAQPMGQQGQVVGVVPGAGMGIEGYQGAQIPGMVPSTDDTGMGMGPPLLMPNPPRTQPRPEPLPVGGMKMDGISSDL